VRVAIIGGGIGGMALALSLHAAGLADVTVYESAPAIRELGVGINLLPHSVRELTELGLLDALLAAGIPTGEYVYCTKRGQEIWHEPLGVAAGYRWPQVSIQRGEMWRGVTPGAPFLAGRTMLNAGASRQRVVVYPISRVAEERGAALINWVATQRTAVGGPLPPQDWTFAADRTAVLDAFAPFAFAFLDVPALIREAAAVYQYPMVDRDPLPTWDFGRVTLLGDAAHPMYPVGATRPRRRSSTRGSWRGRWWCSPRSRRR